MLAFRKLSILIMLILSLSALSAEEPDKVCNAKPSSELLVGDYSMRIGPGTVSMEGMTMPFPESPKIPTKIFELNNKLAMASDDDRLNMTLSIVDENEVPWRFSQSTTFESASSEDIGFVLGCNTTDLPRISGEGWFMSSDNVKVPSTVKLMVIGISENGITAMGVMNSSAQGVTFKVKMSLETQN